MHGGIEPHPRIVFFRSRSFLVFCLFPQISEEHHRRLPGFDLSKNIQRHSSELHIFRRSRRLVSAKEKNSANTSARPPAPCAGRSSAVLSWPTLTTIGKFSPIRFRSSASFRAGILWFYRSCQILFSQSCVQLPVSCESSSLLVRKLSLTRWPRLLAKRVGFCEARRFQCFQNFGQAFRNISVRIFLGDLRSESNNKTKTVLAIMNLGLRSKPIPIHVWILQRQPRQCLH